MRGWSWLLLGLLLLCGGCALMTAQRAEAVGVLNDLLRAGTITPDQFQALLAALQEDQFAVWTERALTVLTGASMAYGAVQLRRGPVTRRGRGVVPSV